MKQLVLYVSLLISLWAISSAGAQSPPHVEVVMSATTAGQNDVIYAEVHVRHDEPIIGADIGIGVNSECLRIEGRENGQYLPDSVIYDELTEASTRLGAHVLGPDSVADPAQFLFRANIRVLCDAGSAEVTVSFAQLVKPDLTDYKLAEQQITTTAGTVTMRPGQPVATAAPLPTRTATAPIPIPTQPSPQAETGDEDDGALDPLPIGIGVVLVVVALVVLTVIFRRRHQE